VVRSRQRAVAVTNTCAQQQQQQQQQVTNAGLASQMLHCSFKTSPT
jgi:hypothetical protein